MRLLAERYFRPANLPWHNPGTRIAPCATGVRVKG